MPTWIGGLELGANQPLNGIAGNFQWSSGEPWRYEHWACNQPDNAGGVERYVAMYYPGHSQASQWNDWADRTMDPIGLPFNAVVEITPGPEVIVQPSVLTLWPGSSAQITATVIDLVAPQYQWLKNGTNLGDGAHVFGSQRPVLDLINVASGDAASYSVVVSTSSGSVTSSPVMVKVTSLPLAGGYAEGILQNAPLAYWRFNDSQNPATDPTAYDLAGGYNGLYDAGISSDYDGISGPRPNSLPGFELSNGALQTFAGGTNPGSVTVPITPTFKTNTATFTAWIYPAANPEPDYAGLFMTRAVTQAGFGYVANGQLGYTWNRNTTYTFQSGLVPPAGQWSFVALVIAPTQATIYLGTAGLLTNVVNAIPHVVETWGGIGKIGSDPHCDVSRTFAGKIDELAVFGHALSPTQVQDLYRRAFRPLQVPVNIQLSGTEFVLTWSEGVLLQADTVAGPWSVLPTAISPFKVSASSGKKFYRVQVQ